MRNILIIILFSFAINANDQIPAPPQKNPILLENGIIHTISNGVIKGSILFDKGKIIRISDYISPPRNAEVINLDGKHVYPGLISAVSRVGLVEINAVDVTNDHSERGNFNPNVRANVAYNPDSHIIPTTRSNGVLIANVTPGSGVVSGQSTIMMMDGWTWEDATFSHPTGLHINWPQMGVRSGGGRWMRMSPARQVERRDKALKELDNMIKDGRAYARLRQTKTRTAKDYHDKDLRWESMIPYVEAKLPIFVHANEIRQIEAAVNWANRHELKIIIVGGKDAWLNTEILLENKIPVIYEVVTALPSRRFEDYDQAYKSPLMLYQAGVKFCISSSRSDAYRVRNLPNQAAMAAAYGLPKEVALRSITLSAAEILGIESQVGSLEAGKDATLFISTGDPLEIRTNVVQAYIQGRKLDMGDKHKSLYNKYQEKYRQLGILKK
tara:strand:+ start:6564 stop:7883 length:1320 start_codon:yes stop_codon:yes gene_type:complete